MGWYDSRYGDYPSTDNVFGREDLQARHTPRLRAFLRRGGALRDFSRAPEKDPQALLAALGRALALVPLWRRP